MAQIFSGFNVPQKWGKNTNYQGGQGGQLVKHALVTWRAIRPKNGIPPGTISGQWEQVPDTITAPQQTVAPTPKPTPVPIAPKVIVTGTMPVRAVNNNVSVDIFQPSGNTAFQGLVPAPPSIAGTALFLREDGTWAAAGGGGTVTSVGLTGPTEVVVTGSPVVAAGTLDFQWVSQTQNLVFCSPNGAPGIPVFRALVVADLPAGTGTVTSVAATVPSEITLTGSPITTSGTLALSWTNQSANTFFAGPTSGGAATPTFRTQVAEDIATGTPTSGYIPYAAGAGVKPAWGSLTLPPPVNASINLFNYQNFI